MSPSSFVSSEREFREAVQSSTSRSEVLRKLDQRVSSSAIRSVNRRISDLSLSIDHFNNPEPSRPRELSEYLKDKGPPIGSSVLRIRLLRENRLPNKCSICALPSEWMGARLTLELDHINGNHRDNRIENLRLLCPNCHSQQPTSGRSHVCEDCDEILLGPTKSGRCRSCYLEQAKQNRKNTSSSKPRTCLSCGLPTFGQRCRSCASRHVHSQRAEKLDWPPVGEILERLHDGDSYLSIGRDVGCSDNAVRKHLKQRGIDPPRKRGAGKI